MEVHAKSVHSWRELLSEIGVIVIGVIIALTAEAVVETIQWKHKVADAETAMSKEFSGDLAYAASQLAMKNCAEKYFARMETAVRDRRADTLRQLAAMGPPINTHPWIFESWTAAINSQIPDHIPRDRLAAYAVGFRRAMTQRERQFIMMDHYNEVVGARLIDNPTPEVSYAQMVALDKLRSEHGLSLLIAQSLISVDGKHLGIEPDAQLLTTLADEPVACEKQLKAIPL
jgi:hypothetical protein